jgi:hypothetical protein
MEHEALAGWTSALYQYPSALLIVADVDTSWRIVKLDHAMRAFHVKLPPIGKNCKA